MSEAFLGKIIDEKRRSLRSEAEIELFPVACSDDNEPEEEQQPCSNSNTANYSAELADSVRPSGDGTQTPSKRLPTATSTKTRSRSTRPTSHELKSTATSAPTSPTGENSTSSPAASPVPEPATQASARASNIQSQNCGEKALESSAKSGPGSSSGSNPWELPTEVLEQSLADAEWQAITGSLSRWPPQTWAQRTDETDYLSLPTLTTGNGSYRNAGQTKCEQRLKELGAIPAGYQFSPEGMAALMGFPLAWFAALVGNRYPLLSTTSKTGSESATIVGDSQPPPSPPPKPRSPSDESCTSTAFDKYLKEIPEQYELNQRQKQFFTAYLHQAFGRKEDALSHPAVTLFVNAQAETFNKESNNIWGDIQLSPIVVRKRNNQWNIAEKVPAGVDSMDIANCRLLFDSGAFPEVRINRRVAPERALERQLEQLAQFPVQPKEVWLVSYDRLIDEKYVDGDRKKERWSVEEAAIAVRETVAAARYLDSQRDRLKGFTLVQSCQGVDAAQYVSCVLQVLEYCQPQDVLGLGGWCILGKQKRWLPTFWEVIKQVVPLIAEAEIQKIHLFGVTWWKKMSNYDHTPLGSLLWLCDLYNISLSCDGRAPIGNALWKSESGNSKNKAGALHDYWRVNLALTRTYLATLRSRPEYRVPPDFERLLDGDRTPLEDTEVGGLLLPKRSNSPKRSRSKESSPCPNIFPKKILGISFGKTRDRLLYKSVTRRMWTERRAKTFIRYFHEGRSIPALDKDRRYGGKEIGSLSLTCAPYPERLAEMPESDLEAEGFPELSKQEFIDRFFDGDPERVVWVLRFNFEPQQVPQPNIFPKKADEGSAPPNIFPKKTQGDEKLGARAQPSTSPQKRGRKKGSRNKRPASGSLNPTTQTKKGKTYPVVTGDRVSKKLAYEHPEQFVWLYNWAVQDGEGWKNRSVRVPPNKVLGVKDAIALHLPVGEILKLINS